MGMLVLFLETRHESFGYLQALKKVVPALNERRIWKPSRCNDSRFSGTIILLINLCRRGEWLIHRETPKTCWFLG
jgi:hypothetical protein